MTVLLAPIDAIVESHKLIVALEQRSIDIPFAEDILAAHRSTHRELEQSHITSEEAVAQWRTALAQRWDSEVAGRRLYKQILRQLIDHFGDSAPQVQMLSRGGAEANSTPSELLEDLRRLHAGLTVESAELPFAQERRAQLEQMCAELERAIDQARTAEHQRRAAVLDSRMAREAYRRICEETQRTLMDIYGDRAAIEFGDVFGHQPA